MCEGWVGECVPMSDGEVMDLHAVAEWNYLLVVARMCWDVCHCQYIDVS